MNKTNCFDNPDLPGNGESKMEETIQLEKFYLTSSVRVLTKLRGGSVESRGKGCVMKRRSRERP